MSHRLLNALEYNNIWDKFYLDYKFSPNYYHGTGISAPSDYITFSIADIEDDKIEILKSIERELINIISFPFYILDWQHDCYIVESMSKYPLGIYPDGDYFIFINSNLTNGSFGHPWRQSICFFGEKVVCKLSERITKDFHIIDQRRPTSGCTGAANAAR